MVTPLTGKLSKADILKSDPGRHSDGNSLFLVVTPRSTRYWVSRITVRGQKNANGAPLRTDIGLGPADHTTIQYARQKALEYRNLAYQGINPKTTQHNQTPTFEEISRQVHRDRLPTWKNPKHGDQFINTLAKYAFPYIGATKVSDIGQPEILNCIRPIWTEKHETARRVAQRIKVVLDVAKSEGHRHGENPVTEIKDAKVLPQVKYKVKHHPAMNWRDMPEFYVNLCNRPAMSALALRFTCLSAGRTSEVLLMRWEELDFADRVWACPAERMKGEREHLVPLCAEMLSIIEPLRDLNSEYVFEGQKRNRPMSNMAMLNLLDRMQVQGATVHGFRSTFRDWASESAKARFEAAEQSLAHKVGNDVSRAYDRTNLLDERRELMGKWADFVTSRKG